MFAPLAVLTAPVSEEPRLTVAAKSDERKFLPKKGETEDAYPRRESGGVPGPA
jgi:hypothetical protein